jgi:hypothetical protein
MGKFADFMMRWTEDIYRLRREELNKLYASYGMHTIQIDDPTDDEPACITK